MNNKFIIYGKTGSQLNNKIMRQFRRADRVFEVRRAIVVRRPEATV